MVFSQKKTALVTTGEYFIYTADVLNQVLYFFIEMSHTARKVLYMIAGTLKRSRPYDSSRTSFMEIIRANLDDSSTGDHSIFYYSYYAALNEVAVRLSCCFLHIIAVDYLEEK